MLGRKKLAEGGSKQAAKKRKWQEELSSDDGGDDEQKITDADLEEFRRTNREEERQEQLERERREREEAKKRKLEEERLEVERRQKEEEEKTIQAELKEAQKTAEAQWVQRQAMEMEVAPPGPHPPDIGGSLPPGVRAGKEHLYKTSYCKRWEQGNCQFGASCHFAHGERELRGRPPKGSSPGTLSVPVPQGKAPPSARTLVMEPGQVASAASAAALASKFQYDGGGAQDGHGQFPGVVPGLAQMAVPQIDGGLPAAQAAKAAGRLPPAQAQSVLQQLLSLQGQVSAAPHGAGEPVGVGAGPSPTNPHALPSQAAALLAQSAGLIRSQVAGLAGTGANPGGVAATAGLPVGAGILPPAKGAGILPGKGGWDPSPLLQGKGQGQWDEDDHGQWGNGYM